MSGRADRMWRDALRAGITEVRSEAERPAPSSDTALLFGSSFSAALLVLYETAQNMAPQEFELTASRQLAHLVGFDGAVWGSGASDPATGQFNIARASLLDRPPALLTNYATIAARDPVTAAFARSPHRLQTMDVLRDYRHRQVLPVRDFLRDHHIGHLMLLGAPQPSTGDAPGIRGTVSWITAYREPGDRPFGADATEVFRVLLPHWMSARRLSAAIHPEGRPVPVPPPSPGVARAQLSAREHQVLDLVARGFTYVQAANHLRLSVTTVRSHARNIYAKLEVHNKTEAVFEARQLCLL